MRKKQSLDHIGVAIASIGLILTPAPAFAAGQPVDHVWSKLPPCYLRVVGKVFGYHYAMVSCNAGEPTRY